MKTTEVLIQKAKVAEQAERYDDMVDAMTKLIRAEPGISADARNLVSVAYKNVIGTRRNAWRIITALEKKEDVRNDPVKLEVTQEYRMKIENELREICNNVLDLISKYLLPAAQDGESQVFYHKMKGDYYRYLSEFTSNEERTKSASNSQEAYVAAMNIAKSKLAAFHPIRLGLALNFSVFYYEILNKPKEACEMAKTAFDEAIVLIESPIDEEHYKDSTLIMQLLRDNLTLWNSDPPVEEPEAETEKAAEPFAGDDC